MNQPHFEDLSGHRIVKWVATEMALTGGNDEDSAVLWGDPGVPYLQLLSIDFQIDDGTVYRMLAQSDDGSGYYGLYLERKDASEIPCDAEHGSIYRTRELRELPAGVAAVTVTEIDGPHAVLRVAMAVSGHTISFWAAEVYERSDGRFEAFGRDESILVQVDGVRPVETD